MAALGLMALPAGFASGAAARDAAPPAKPLVAAEAEPVDPNNGEEALPLDLPDNISLAVAPAGWLGFFDFALAAASKRASGEPANSAVLSAESSSTGIPAVQQCARGDSAVLLDIDPGKDAFSPDTNHLPVPGLAEGLADLRANGIVVLWISQLGSEHVNDLAEILQSTGLDPEGRDPILLGFKPDDRKQVIRENASAAVCVLAIAGDRMGDFHELFDYLRDPANARFFSEPVGAGWFLVPLPLSEQKSAGATPATETSGQISP